MKVKIIGIITVLFIAGIAIASFTPGKQDRKPKLPPKDKRVSQLYRGLDYTVYSSSTLEAFKSSYVFKDALQYDYVEHAFIIKNDSPDPLEIKKAVGSGGCRVSSYSRKIPPGLTGRMSVMIITDTLGGQGINGIVRAETSDKNNPEIIIDISCFIKKVASVSPYTINLIGSYTEELEGTSIVIPADDFPFKITGIKPKKDVDIAYSYKEVEKDGKKGYSISVRNTKKEKGVYRDILYIQTDNPKRPEFRIRVWGDVRA